jgi:2-amino-4-hydroxy-6-hydroxymethyldihydropteridine diphosphokinase
VQLLQRQGQVEKISNAWESESVGADGPNYLNACILLVTPLNQVQLKETVILPIELQLGRERTDDKFAPRSMDIDIVLFDGQSCDEKYWEQSFVVVPLAEIYPEYINPLTHESISKTATRLRQSIWMEARRDVLSQFSDSTAAA